MWTRLNLSRSLLLWLRIQTRHGSSSSEELVARWRVDKILMKFLWIDFPLSFFYSVSITSRRRCPGCSVALFSLRASCVLLCQEKFQRIGKTPSFNVCGGEKWVKNQKQHTTERETWLHFTSVTIYIYTVVASNVCNCRHTVLWAVYADAPHFFPLFPFPHIQIDFSLHRPVSLTTAWRLSRAHMMNVCIVRRQAELSSLQNASFGASWVICAFWWGLPRHSDLVRVRAS